MKLNNFCISVKVLMIVGLLSAVTVIVGALGYINTERLGVATEEVDLARLKAILGAEITSDLRGMSRYEYRVAANPTPEAIQQSERNAAAYRKEIEENFARIKATADAEQRRLLEEIEREAGAYFTSLAATFQLARDLSSQAQIGEVQQRLYQGARGSREAADRAEKLLDVFNDYAREKARETVEGADAPATERNRR